jgi:hypothetical protein
MKAVPSVYYRDLAAAFRAAMVDVNPLFRAYASERPRTQPMTDPCCATPTGVER